jgi:hypothetical protein
MAAEITGRSSPHETTGSHRVVDIAVYFMQRSGKVTHSLWTAVG